MRKKLIAVLLIACLLLTACGFIVVDDAGETVLSGILGGTAHGEAEKAVSDGERTDAQIQQRLIDLGFLTGKADGIFGPRSVSALQAFQTYCGFEATGEKDAKTLDMLFGDPAALPTPSPTPLAGGARDDENSTDVKDIQERLIALNYLSGKADGIFGAGTRRALESFQELNGLEVTGVADEKTLAKLEDSKAAPMPTPEPTPRTNGAKGEDIKAVQEALRVMGFMAGNADGSYGNATGESVKRYQQYVHDREIEAMEANPTPTPVPTPVPTPSPTPTARPTPDADATASIELLNDGGKETAQPTLEPETETETVEGEVEAAYIPDGIITDELMADILAYNDVLLYQEDLTRGSKGGEVARLQRRLASLWYLNTTSDIDGQFGGGTANAVSYFQKRNSLTQTGVADKATQLALFSAEAKKSDRPANLYKLKISVDKQRVYAYKWVNGDYTELVRTMVCSTGTKDNPTPYGTFSAAGAAGRWYYFKKFDCWAQYAYRISGPYLFHSVLYSAKDESTLRQGSVSNLGSRASHGCIRLKVEDAKWIYNNCPAGTTVVVY